MAELQKYVTPAFRLSFPNVFTASTYQSAEGGKSEPKFGFSAIWTPKNFSEPDKKRWSAILKALDAESKKTFGKAWKELPANIKRGIRDGAEKADLEGYGEGTRFANITSKMKPGVIDVNKNDVGPEHGNAELVFPGAWARATVTVYSYNNKGKGVALGLQNLQILGKGERLDSRTNASEDFADEDVDDKWLDDTEEPSGAEEDDENDF